MTDLCWNPAYNDLFAVAFGSCIGSDVYVGSDDDYVRSGNEYVGSGDDYAGSGDIYVGSCGVFLDHANLCWIKCVHIVV